MEEITLKDCFKFTDRRINKGLEIDYTCQLQHTFSYFLDKLCIFKVVVFIQGRAFSITEWKNVHITSFCICRKRHLNRIGNNGILNRSRKTNLLNALRNLLKRWFVGGDTWLSKLRNVQTTNFILSCFWNVSSLLL